MAWRSKALVVVSTAVIVLVVVAALILRVQLRCAGFPGGGVTAAELPPPAASGALRVAHWNVRNFPLSERPPRPGQGYATRTNICDLETALAGLDAHILGLTEIRDTKRLPRVLRRAAGRRYDVVTSNRGGRGGLRLAIAWDADRLAQASVAGDIDSVAIRPTLRPGFWVRLKDPASPDREILVVQLHLKAGPKGVEDRRLQVRALVEWLDTAVAADPPFGLVVQGDFNVVGGSGLSAEDEWRRVDAVLSRVGLARLPSAQPCSMYWEGPGEPDDRYLPSLLDVTYIRGFDGLQSSEAESWLHCRRLNCDPLISAPGREDATFYDVSDHCPVTVDLGGFFATEGAAPAR
jgi:endonuclease/exonuclease/phosphatase family metal-dependent hydrolase